MTTYVVYDSNTAVVYSTYQSATTASRMTTRLNNQLKKQGKPAQYGWSDRDQYNQFVDVEVETYNMLDPERKPIKIRKSLKGGCCDPATETYHAM